MFIQLPNVHVPLYIYFTYSVVEKIVSVCPKVLLIGDDCGNLPIHLACQSGNVDIVKKLLPAMKKQENKSKNKSKKKRQKNESSNLQSIILTSINKR